MAYKYEDFKDKVCAPDNQLVLLNTYRRVLKFGKMSNTVKMQDIFNSGDLWLSMAYVDRLVELGILQETTPNKETCWGQNREFIIKHNL